MVMKYPLLLAFLAVFCTIVEFSVASFMPAFPLSTNSRWIVDTAGTRVKLACVNWSGAEEKDSVVGGLDKQPLDSLSSKVSDYGFNCVRLLWSVEMFNSNPLVPAIRLIANPELVSLTALEIFDKVVESLSNHNVMVILDNHMSDADWCCSESDNNGLWYTDKYDEAMWINAWLGMAQRYLTSTWVIGAELRNELRGAVVGGRMVYPTWGSGDSTTDWRLAATRCGNEVLSVVPHWLIFVDGLHYATDLRDVYNHPITLAVSDRLVYAPHDYSWSQRSFSSYSAFKKLMGNQWGYILTQDREFTAPLWVSEFGTSHDGSGMGDGSWWSYMVRYLSEADIDWAYWRLDGTESNGTGRVFGAEETFGVLDMAWDGPAHNGTLLLRALQGLQAATQGPGIDRMPARP